MMNAAYSAEDVQAAVPAVGIGVKCRAETGWLQRISVVSNHIPASSPGLSRRPRAVERGAIEVAGTSPATTRARWQWFNMTGKRRRALRALWWQSRCREIPQRGQRQGSA